jgi:hypothetical protein
MAVNLNFGRINTKVAIVIVALLVLVGGGFGIYYSATHGKTSNVKLEIALSVNSTFVYVRNGNLEQIDPKSTSAVAKIYSIKKGETVKVTLKLTTPDTGMSWVIKENDAVLSVSPTDPTDGSVGLTFLFDVKMNGNKKITYYQI